MARDRTHIWGFESQKCPFLTLLGSPVLSVMCVCACGGVGDWEMHSACAQGHSRDAAC